MPAAIAIALAWLRKHLSVVGGAAIAVAAGFIAWGSMQRRTTSLKAAVRAEHDRVKAAGDLALSDDASKRAEVLSRQDADIGIEVDEAQRAAAARSRTGDLSDAEVVEKLNERYRKPPG